jgi:hypothetical protein
VVAYQHQSRFHGAYEYPNKRMRARDEKEQLNRFLGEYLSLCLAVGMSPEGMTLPNTIGDSDNSDKFDGGARINNSDKA